MQAYRSRMQGSFDIQAHDVNASEARCIAREYARQVRAHFGERLRSIRLFGSAARGDWTSESDIDVLVLLDEVRGADKDWLIQRALALGVLDRGIVLQPLYMAEDRFTELRERERSFALEVEREGILL